MSQLGKITVSEFVKRFVPHNYIVYLYSVKRYKRCNTIGFDYEILWHGQDWEIVDIYYLKDKDIEPCKYKDFNVISTVRVPSEENNLKKLVFSDEIDVIGLVIEFKDEVE